MTCKATINKQRTIECTMPDGSISKITLGTSLIQSLVEGEPKLKESTTTIKGRKPGKYIEDLYSLI